MESNQLPEFILHSSLVMRFDNRFKFYYLLRSFDVKGNGTCNIKIQDIERFGYPKKKLKRDLSYLLQIGAIRDYDLSPVRLLVYYTSARRLANIHDIKLGVCGWCPLAEINELKKAAVQMTAQSVQNQAEFLAKKSANKTGNAYLGSAEVLNKINFDYDVTPGDIDVLADRDYLPDTIGNRALGYNPEQKTLIVVENVQLGLASQKTIAARLGVSIRTVGQYLKDTKKLRIAKWSPQIQKMGLLSHYTDDSHMYIRFQRQGKGTFNCLLQPNMYIETPYVLVRLRNYKRETAVINRPQHLIASFANGSGQRRDRATVKQEVQVAVDNRHVYFNAGSTVDQMKQGKGVCANRQHLSHRASDNVSDKVAGQGRKITSNSKSDSSSELSFSELNSIQASKVVDWNQTVSAACNITKQQLRDQIRSTYPSVLNFI